MLRPSISSWAKAALLLGSATLTALGCGSILDASGYHTVPPTDDGGGVPDTNDLPDTNNPPPPSGDSSNGDVVTAECTGNADCAAHGDYFVCRSAKCVGLQTPDCSRVVGDYKNDAAIVFGSLLPTAGPDLSSGLPLQDGIELAIADFAQVGNLPPVPGTKDRRPLVLVGCNDNSDDQQAIRAAHHLVDDLKVPAIIGAAFSGITIKVATQVTIPANTILISPSATSTAITDLQDNGLVWRTSPSDVLQAKAHALLLPLVETEVRSRDGLTATDKLKVAIAHKSDAYGSGLATALGAQASFNGLPALDPANDNYFKTFDYGDPDDPVAHPPNYPATITAITGYAPHIIYLFGITEVITDMLKGIEASWPVAAPKPFYLVADGAFIPEAWGYFQNNDPTGDARKRFLGTTPGTNSANYQTFRNLYNGAIHDGTSADVAGTANAYDALYSLAYAAVAIGDKPLTGPNLATGFPKQVPPGQKITVGASNINATFQLLLAGQQFDLDGASGPLDYDLKTGDTPSDIQIWCVPLDANNNPAAGANTGLFFDASKTALSAGGFGTIKTACKF